VRETLLSGEDYAAHEGQDHGGDLAAAARLFPWAPRPWLDLSTGINPFAYPYAPLAPEIFTRLPETCVAIEATARQAYAVPPHAGIVAAPGSQALIQALPRLWAARGRPLPRVGILGPTYTEHAANWRSIGAPVEEVRNFAALDAMDVAVIVNPNNPDGRLTAADDLCALAARLVRRDGLLVVDEAFMDLERSEAHLVPQLPRAGVIVLRSFGKTYGLGGLRLGFAIAEPGLAEDLRTWFGAWAVSGPAIAIGRQALSDAAWRERTGRRLTAQIAVLDGFLKGAGFTICGGTRLFRLTSHPQAAVWFQRLGEAGIYVRRFADAPDKLRFGIPGDDRSLMRLGDIFAKGL